MWLCGLQLSQCEGSTLNKPTNAHGIFHTLALYEQAIKPSAQQPRWRNLRESWLSKLRDISRWSKAWYASLLLLVEKSILAESQNWSPSQRNLWISECQKMGGNDIALDASSDSNDGEDNNDQEQRALLLLQALSMALR